MFEFSQWWDSEFIKCNKFNIDENKHSETLKNGTLVGVRDDVHITKHSNISYLLKYGSLIYIICKTDENLWTVVTLFVTTT